MLKIGLTGGIGSGKSTVAAIFEVLGIPVYYADSAARQLMESDTGIVTAIVDLFGADAYQNRKLNREFLAQTIFQQPDLRMRLNGIVHPATIADAHRWFMQQTSPYAIKEAALIFESKSEAELDAVIGVAAPEKLRCARVMKRDRITENEFNARLKSQLNEQEKIKQCKFVIHNDELQLLIPQVLDIHAQLMAIAYSS